MINYNDKDLFHFKEAHPKKIEKTLNKLERIEKVQQAIEKDSLFSKTISIVDFIKALNMAYHSNSPDPTKYYNLNFKKKGIAGASAAKRQKKYMADLFKGDVINGGFSIKEVLDTNNQTIRVRCQMKDLGSYDVAQKVKKLKVSSKNFKS